MPSSHSTHPPPRIGRLLVVDDDAKLMKALRDTLDVQGYETIGFTNPTQALQALREQEFDLLLTDLQMPEMDGIALIQGSLGVDPNLVPIVMTGQATIQTAVKAMQNGAFDYVEKPLKIRDLLPTLSRAMEVRRLRRENLQLRETLGIYELSVAIGFTLDVDTILNKVMDAALQQCDGDEVSILLPTSDGKELHVATARGPRREKIQGQRVPMDQSIAGWVARHREPVILQGPVDDVRFAPAHPRTDIFSAISMPMMVGGKCVGVLNINATHYSRPFALGQIKALTLLTGTAAPALKAASLYAQLRASEERFRRITVNMLDLVCQVGIEGSLEYVTPSCESILGYRSEDLEGTPALAIVHPEDQVRCAQFFEQAHQAAEPVRGEFRYRRADGNYRWLESVASAVKGVAGRPQCLITASRDITERKRAEETITKNNELLRILHQIDRALIASEGPEAIAAVALPALRELLGVPRVVVNLFDLAKGEVEWLAAAGRHRVRVRPGVRYSLQFMGDLETMRRGEPQTVDVATLPPGAEVDALLASGVHSYVVVPMIAEGQLIGALSFGGATGPSLSEQITIAQGVAAQFAVAIMQTRFQEQIKRQEQEFRQVWSRSVDGMRLTNAQGIIVMVNDAYSRMVSKPKEALEGKPYTTVYAGGDLEQMLSGHQERFASQTIEPHFTKEAVLWNEKRVHLEFSNSFLEVPGNPPQLLSIIRDVTPQKNLEQQFRQAQKMEAFGQLAGGVAHDFNNLLTIIAGYCEMLLGGDVPPGKQRDLIREIRKAGDRATSLTRQLLAFSRKQMLQPVELDLNSLVRDTEKMLRRLIGEDIDLATTLDPDLGWVKADPGQIEQVVMNLVINARDAMPRGGLLTIETQNVELDAVYAQNHAEIQPGRFVMLAVTDSGCGMDEATRSKIFEPFFTTKEVGKGTGLGLATVHGIVKQSGGSIEVYSEPNRGTTIKIYLPRVRSASSSNKSLPGLPLMPGGTETILFTEDEDAVRAMARLALESCGYTVLDAGHGDEALRICQQFPGRIHLLMTDVVMPQMSGRELADHVLALRPGIKVLYVSGYTDDAVVRHGVLEADMAFLQKPFSLHVLARKVREVLGLNATGGS